MQLGMVHPSEGVFCSLQKQKVQNNNKDVWFSMVQEFSSGKVIRGILPIFSPFFCKSRDTNRFQM